MKCLNPDCLNQTHEGAFIGPLCVPCHNKVETARKLLKAVGYNVSRPRQKKLTKVGPTCVVRWADGVTTRMSINTPDDQLNFARGLRVSASAWQVAARRALVPGLRAAVKNHAHALAEYDNLEFAAAAKERRGAKLAVHYAKRTLDAHMARWQDMTPEPLPRVLSCHFERNGEVLATCPSATITEVTQ